MASNTEYRDIRRIELSWTEITGALGDSVTVLPIVIALAATTQLSLSRVLLLFGVFQVVWGLVYGLPLSVEPMKALAGLAIAGAISASELAGAGLLAGGTLLILGRLDAVSGLQAAIGRPVVRGVQLAVALLLVRTGLELGAASPGTAALGLGLALVVVLAGYRRASALVVLGVGLVVAVAATGVPTARVPTGPLSASAPAFTAGAIEATLAQLAMTVGNAAVATSLLCADLFDREVSPDALSSSMGATNLLAVPLGGVPMCHGSGGLAGKYAFGARTGGANVLLGVGYAAAALVAGAGLLAAFPTALLGVLLALIAIELGRTALFGTDRAWLDRGLAVGVGVVGLASNVGVAFVVGVLAWWVLAWTGVVDADRGPGAFGSG